MNNHVHFLKVFSSHFAMLERTFSDAYIFRNMRAQRRWKHFTPFSIVSFGLIMTQRMAQIAGEVPKLAVVCLLILVAMRMRLLAGLPRGAGLNMMRGMTRMVMMGMMLQPLIWLLGQGQGCNYYNHSTIHRFFRLLQLGHHNHQSDGLLVRFDIQTGNANTHSLVQYRLPLLLNTEVY